jgi:transcriptional regulator with XRE-family HTH domain
MTPNFPSRPLPSLLRGRSVAVMDADDVATGRRLKAARTAAGMKTRKELTDAAGLHRVGDKVLGMIERGQRKLQPHEADAFAQALNIDARAFYDDPEGTQLDRLEQAVADIRRREENAQTDRDAIKALLAQQSQILRDISDLLARQDAILLEMQRVAAGLPADSTLRTLNQRLREGAVDPAELPGATLPEVDPTPAETAAPARKSRRGTGGRRRAG